MSLMTSSVNFPLRAAKAAGTRAAVLAAAHRLFLEQGYAATTAQQIADAAGVSRATVFNSVGGKAAVLRACYDVATVGDDEKVPLPQRPGLLAVRTAADPASAIALYAKVVTEVSGRLSGIYEVFRAAATNDAEIRTSWQQVQAERLGGAQGFIRILAQQGPLRKGLDREEAGDVVWAFIDASLYQRLVPERGWSPSRFERWLTRHLSNYLLD
jgi:AcrR family transcriptional regulator